MNGFNLRGWTHRLAGIVLLSGFCFWGCAAVKEEAATPTIQPTTSPSPRPSQSATPTSRPPTPTQTPTIPPTPTPTLEICSPLDGIEIAQIDSLIHNPFNPPPPGSDNPHPAIDLYDLDPNYQIALTGRPVQAVLSGRVAAVISDRFPYGNAVLVETHQEELPAAWWYSLPIPTPGIPWEAPITLTCPGESLGDSAPWGAVYLLYAHLDQPPTLKMGDRVACGQNLGAIGNSGNSLNPHLHLEARFGPAGHSFESMAHYTGNANPQEMQNYCRWRVSGIFQAVNPQVLFGEIP